MSPKLWHWDYFQTRAQLYSNPDAPKDYHGKNCTFENAWCTACIQDFQKCTNESDEQLLAQGSISKVRSSKELLDLAIKNVHPVSGCCEGFEVHIRHCSLIHKEARSRLQMESTRSQRVLSPGSPSSGEQVSESEALATSESMAPSQLSKAQQEHFKQAGMANLEKELEIYSLSTRELEEEIKSVITPD